MKWITTALVVCVLGGAVLLHLQRRSLWSATVLYSRIELKRALKDLSEIGQLRDYGNETKPFMFTNKVVVAGAVYECAVAYKLHASGLGFLAATTNGVFIWIDQEKGPRLLPAEGRP